MQNAKGKKNNQLWEDLCIWTLTQTGQYTQGAHHLWKELSPFRMNMVKSGTFNIVMTNISNKNIKVFNNQTMGMLRPYQDEQICTIHRIVTFDKNWKEGEERQT